MHQRIVYSHKKVHSSKNIWQISNYYLFSEKKKLSKRHSFLSVISTCEISSQDRNLAKVLFPMLVLNGWESWKINDEDWFYCFKPSSTFCFNILIGQRNPNGDCSSRNINRQTGWWIHLLREMLIEGIWSRRTKNDKTKQKMTYFIFLANWPFYISTLVLKVVKVVV